MRHSENVDKIIPALLEAQRGIRCAVRDSSNPFHKTMYADISSVIESCKPHLNQNGIVFVQSPDAGQDSGLVGVETTLFHVSGQFVSSVCSVPVPPKRDAQAIGAAITYARRYGLQAILGIPTEDDDGNSIMNNSPNKHYQSKQSKSTPALDAPGAGESMKKIYDYFSSKGICEADVMAYIGKSPGCEVTDDDINSLREIAKSVSASNQRPANGRTSALRDVLEASGALSASKEFISK